MPLCGAQICHKGVLLESKKGCFSSVCGPMSLILRRMVRKQRRSWEEDEWEVVDVEGDNETLRRVSKVSLTW